MRTRLKMRIGLSLICLFPVVSALIKERMTGIIEVSNFKLVREDDSGCDGKNRPDQSIFDMVSNNARLKLMAQTIRDAGLEPLLKQQQQDEGDGSKKGTRMTLFAPTNAAFWNLEAVRPGFLLRLSRDDWNFHIEDLVLHHVTTDSEFCQDTFFDQQVFPLENGDEAEVKINSNGIFLLPSSDVRSDDTSKQLEMVKLDQSASNGVIHEVHRVFLTQWYYRDVIRSAADEGYTTFAEMAAITGLEPTFSDNDRIMTVFYPTNEAFAELPQEVLQCLLEQTDVLAQVLLSHATQNGVIHTTSLQQQQAGEEPVSYTSLLGTTLSVASSSDGTITLNGSAHLVQPNILAYNGIGHGIDKVFFSPDFECQPPPPPPPPLIEPLPTALDALKERPDYTNITHLISMAGEAAGGLDAILADVSEHLTFFAPTDHAFEHISPEILSCLIRPPSEQDTSILSSFLLYNLILDRKMWSSNWTRTHENTIIFTTAEGAPLLIHQTDTAGPTVTVMETNSATSVNDGSGGVSRADDDDTSHFLFEINNDGATVIEKDIPACNGVIHGISRVIFAPDFVCP